MGLGRILLFVGLLSQLLSPLGSGNQLFLQAADKLTSIRIVKLQRCNEDDASIRHLSTAYFDNKPAYEAISYVWGYPEVKEAIICDRRLQIPVNLVQGLRRMRPKDKKWIL
jgi:hypothetical protein